MLNINLKLVKKKLLRNREVSFFLSNKNLRFVFLFEKKKKTKNLPEMEGNWKNHLGYTFCALQGWDPVNAGLDVRVWFLRQSLT